jgi:putative membrane-bound dehydrogenase-like protein
LVLLGGELVVDYAVRLRRELRPDRLWVIGYANSIPGYIPSERILREGGYEGGDAMVYYDWPAPFAAGLEQRIVDVVRELVPPPLCLPRGTDGTEPSPPDAAQRRFRVADGLAVELVAAEPLCVDPVAIDFGPDGRLWVAEMRDYPSGIDGRGAPGGRITVLTDDDGDGRADRASVFADRLPFPTGVTVWRDGVLVCAAPDVLWLRDRDGDGAADERRVVLTGFAAHNEQARVNSLRLGLDGFVYAASGLFGGILTSPAGHAADVRGRDLRFDPDTGAVEPAAGLSQQGRARDDFGNWFGCDSGALLRHYPLSDHWLARNQDVAAPPPSVDVPVDAAARRLLVPDAAQQMFALSGPVGAATAACGVDIYRDDVLGADHRGNAFTCEPVHRSVHRLVLEPRGTTFVGRRASGEAEREFLWPIRGSARCRSAPGPTAHRGSSTCTASWSSTRAGSRRAGWPSSTCAPATNAGASGGCGRRTRFCVRWRGSTASPPKRWWKRSTLRTAPCAIWCRRCSAGGPIRRRPRRSRRSPARPTTRRSGRRRCARSIDSGPWTKRLCGARSRTPIPACGVRRCGSPASGTPVGWPASRSAPIPTRACGRRSPPRSAGSTAAPPRARSPECSRMPATRGSSARS